MKQAKRLNSYKIRPEAQWLMIMMVNGCDDQWAWWSMAMIVNEHYGK